MKYTKQFLKGVDGIDLDLKVNKNSLQKTDEVILLNDRILLSFDN